MHCSGYVYNEMEPIQECFFCSDERDYPGFAFSTHVMMDQEFRPLRWSNSYIDDISAVNRLYTADVPKLLQSNFEWLKNSVRTVGKDAIETIETELIPIFCVSAFYSSNSGHDLAFCLEIVQKLINITRAHLQTQDFDVILATVSAKYAPVLMRNQYPFVNRLISLFFDRTILLNPGTIYRIPQLRLFRPTIMFNGRYPDETLNFIKSKCDEGLDVSSHPPKVLLIRLAHHRMVRKNLVCFRPDDIQFLSDRHGFVVLDPENIDPFKLVSILSHASVIVTQCGSISYTNHIFFSRKAKIIVVEHNRNEFDFYKACFCLYNDNPIEKVFASANLLEQIINIPGVAASPKPENP